ncbi:hypothetical protein [Rhodopirellula bahusiensis]
MNSSPKRMSAEVFFASRSRTSEGRNETKTLLQQIESASAGLKSVAKEAAARSTPHPQSPSEEANIARETAWAIAVRIVQESGPQIPPPDWIAEYVQEQVDEAVANYEQREIDPETGQTKWDYSDPNAAYGFASGGFGGGPQMITTPAIPDWLLSRELFLSAIEMRREGRLDLPIQFAAETLAYPRFNWYSMDDSSLNDLVQALATIDPEAPSLIAFHLDRSFQEMDRQYQASQNAEWLHPLTYLQQRLEEGLATVYAAHVDHPKQAHDRLELLVKIMPNLPSLVPINTEDPKAFWHAMLNDLKQRFESE